MIDWLQLHIVALLNVIVIDVVLAGDNAIIVGLAASRVREEIRTRVIFWGTVGAVVLRVIFALITQRLLDTIGLTLAGGILLLGVCWKMYRELVRGRAEEAREGLTAEDARVAAPMTFRAAVAQIILADVSMSLDNVLAVAGVAKGEPLVLVVGLGVAIVLMAVAANFIAKMLARHPWVSWIGLLIIVWVALDMILRGSRQVGCIWCAEDLPRLLRELVRH